ncbi:hypothetical protein DFH11DRAFT_1554255 [Phellopilus nigrolimitatus]|nr:hypothetical protein DFH11DRAFT_1554255 [Phellopilus nigrolimitatus]
MSSLPPRSASLPETGASAAGTSVTGTSVTGTVPPNAFLATTGGGLVRMAIDAFEESVREWSTEDDKAMLLEGVWQADFRWKTLDAALNDCRDRFTPADYEWVAGMKRALRRQYTGLVDRARATGADLGDLRKYAALAAAEAERVVKAEEEEPTLEGPPSVVTQAPVARKRAASQEAPCEKGRADKQARVGSPTAGRDEAAEWAESPKDAGEETGGGGAVSDAGAEAAVGTVSGLVAKDTAREDGGAERDGARDADGDTEMVREWSGFGDGAESEAGGGWEDGADGLGGADAVGGAAAADGSGTAGGVIVAARGVGGMEGRVAKVAGRVKAERGTKDEPTWTEHTPPCENCKKTAAKCYRTESSKVCQKCAHQKKGCVPADGDVVKRSRSRAAKSASVVEESDADAEGESDGEGTADAGDVFDRVTAGTFVARMDRRDIGVLRAALLENLVADEKMITAHSRAMDGLYVQLGGHREAIRAIRRKLEANEHLYALLGGPRPDAEYGTEKGKGKGKGKKAGK